ncbi:hypothetical protein AACB50_00020, partial [Enterococcus faecalis]
VTPTMFGNAKRTTTGLDFNRVSLIMAGFEKRGGLFFKKHEAGVKTAGGVKIKKTDLDLMVSIRNAFLDKEKRKPSSESFFGGEGVNCGISPVNPSPPMNLSEDGFLFSL